MSRCCCKDLCSNFVVIAKRYLVVDSYLDEASELKPEIYQERQVVGGNEREAVSHHPEACRF